MDLKKRAKEIGVKQKDIAAALNVSEGTVSKWLSGEMVVSSYYLRTLADILKVPVDELLPRAGA